MCLPWPIKGTDTHTHTYTLVGARGVGRENVIVDRMNIMEYQSEGILSFSRLFHCISFTLLRLYPKSHSVSSDLGCETNFGMNLASELLLCLISFLD